MINRGKTKYSVKGPIPVSLCPQQVPHGLQWDWIQILAVRNQYLWTAWVFMFTVHKVPEEGSRNVYTAYTVQITNYFSNNVSLITHNGQGITITHNKSGKVYSSLEYMYFTNMFLWSCIQVYHWPWCSFTEGTDPLLQSYSQCIVRNYFSLHFVKYSLYWTYVMQGLIRLIKSTWWV